MNTQPTAIISSITAIAAAVITLLVAYGVDINDEQQKAILALLTVLAPVISGALIWFKVWPKEHVLDVRDEAYNAGLTQDPKPRV